VTEDLLAKLPADADVVFVIDTTGSMLWAIEGAKSAVSNAMKAAPERQYGVVIFRDRGDSYVKQTLAPLSLDIASALKGIDEMSAGEGGDYPESVAVGLDAGLNQPWRTDKEKHIILIGDAPDHEYPDDVVSMDSIAQKATELGVVIHAIGVPCGDTCKEEIGAK
jgi:Mg-chelatase subunit ChlD